MMKGEDRISSLPDCLIVEILSRLGDTKYAIRTGTLSKRWQHLWNQQVYNLIIDIPQSSYNIPQFYSSLERILSQSDNLKRFKLHAFYTNQTKSQVNNCIRNAISHSVHEVDLHLSFIHLTLYNCEFTQAVVVSWENLRTLRIEDAELDQLSIKNVLSGSPLLETSTMHRCYGFELLDITNKSVKNLVFSDLGALEINYVQINVLYILSLTIQDFLPFGKLLLLNMSSLIEVQLAYYQAYFAESMKLVDETNEEILQDLLLSLGHVKEVAISSSTRNPDGLDNDYIASSPIL
ncbi:F-box/LRR-repeat protein 25-like protein [Tanacetum coccineum]